MTRDRSNLSCLSVHGALGLHSLDILILQRDCLEGPKFPSRDLGCPSPSQPHTPLIHIGRSKHKKASSSTPRPEAQLSKQVGKHHPNPSLGEGKRKLSCAKTQETATTMQSQHRSNRVRRQTG